MTLTEQEVLEKLVYYKNAIIALQSDRAELKNKCSVLEAAADTANKELADMKTVNQDLTEQVQRLTQDNESQSLAYNSLLVQYNTLLSQNSTDDAFKDEVEKVVMDIQTALESQQ